MDCLNNRTHYNIIISLSNKFLKSCVKYIIISENLITKIDVLLDLINLRDENINWDGFTKEEIIFMII